MGKDRHAVQRHSRSFGRAGILFGASLFCERRNGKGKRIFCKSPQKLRMALVQKQEFGIQKTCRGENREISGKPTVPAPASAAAEV